MLEALPVRWRKGIRDVLAERGRVALMLAAILVSLSAVATVLGAYAILTREISVAYMGTHPADVTLELPDGVDAHALAVARLDPEVEEAEAREVILARVRVGADRRPLLLFVADDVVSPRLNLIHPERGAWPPPPNTALLERSATQVVGDVDALEVKLPGLPAQTLAVSGLAYDPGLAPAWQEREGYAYLSTATFAALGGDPALHELRVAFRGAPVDPAVLDARAAALAQRLSAAGIDVHQIRIPSPHQHPHQRQMTTILVLLLSFTGLALLLSAILTANSLAAMLARQVREIGVMKTIGATAGQVGALYAALVIGLGLASTLLAWPLGALAARGLARDISGMLNFTLTSEAMPGWVPTVIGLAGVGVPLLLAWGPIRRASRATVRDALDSHGTGPSLSAPWLARLPPAARSALRRPRRLALTLGLLASGGAMFLSALDVSRSWELNTEKILATRHYDLDVRLHAPTADARLDLPGARAVERWGYSTGAFGRPGRVDVVHTWPDRGHGSLTVFGCPPDTALVSFPVLAGRWLRADDVAGAVLSHAAAAQLPGVQVGDLLHLSIDGTPWEGAVVGIVEEIGSPGSVYLTRDAFATATGTAGEARLLRVVTDSSTGAGTEAAIRGIEAALSEVPLDAVVPLSELDAAVGEHVQILINALIALAAVMATVGGLGLASAMGTAVLERTRELGILQALGATPGRIRSMLLGEALLIAGTSWALAVVGSLPLTWALDLVIGNLGFLAPLPFAVTPLPILGWLGGVLLIATLATALPARRAARMTVREALAEV